MSERMQVQIYCAECKHELCHEYAWCKKCVRCSGCAPTDQVYEVNDPNVHRDDEWEIILDKPGGEAEEFMFAEDAATHWVEHFSYDAADHQDDVDGIRVRVAGQAYSQVFNVCVEYSTPSFYASEVK